MIGLSSYAFQWRSSAESAQPIDLFDMIAETAELGVNVFQICDQPAIEEMSDLELATLLQHAQSHGVRLELGTRGIGASHLSRYLELAKRLEVTFVRSMLHVPDHRPGNDEARELLRRAMSAYEEQAVSLGLETYEQVATADLVAIVEAVNSPSLGICLDPANTVARLEMPGAVISACASRVNNVHVKDFVFTRADGWAGFSLVGCALGAGLLPYDDMIAAVDPDERGINLIVEHWVPRAETIEKTCSTEREWTRHNVEFMRARARSRE